MLTMLGGWMSGGAGNYLGGRHISSGQVAHIGGQHEGGFFFILRLDLDLHAGGPPLVRGCCQQHKSPTQP